MPIYAATSYVFHNSQHAADRFGLKDAGNIYGRLTNLTEDIQDIKPNTIRLSIYLNPMEFLKEAPVLPIALFGLAVVGFVGLAYYFGRRRIWRCNLAEALGDDCVNF